MTGWEAKNNYCLPWAYTFIIVSISSIKIIIKNTIRLTCRSVSLACRLTDFLCMLLTPSRRKSHTTEDRDLDAWGYLHCRWTAEQIGCGSCAIFFLSTQRDHERLDIWRSGQYLSTNCYSMIPLANVDFDRSRRDGPKHRPETLEYNGRFYKHINEQNPTESQSPAARRPHPPPHQHLCCKTIHYMQLQLQLVASTWQS